MSTNDDIRIQLNQAKVNIDAALALLPSGAAPITIGPSDNLQSILSTAPAGSIVKMDPLFVLESDLVLVKPVTLITSIDPGSARVSSSLKGATLRGALTSTASDVSLIGLRLEGKVSGSTIVTTSPRMVIDRCVVLGSAQGQHRGIRADSDTVSITRSSISNIWYSADSQAIAGWDGCKHLTVDDCYLEASGENVLFGGADSVTAAGIPQDISINNCTMFKPLSWIGKAGLTAKNLFETKSVQRLHVTNCRMENSWVNGQTGYAMLINVRNQDGKAPWSVVEDVTIEDCTFNNTTNGIEILGRDYTNPSGVMDRVTIRRCTFTNIGTTWSGGAAGGRQIFITGGPRNLTLDHISFAGKIEPEGTAMSFDTPEYPLVNLRVSDCRFLEGFYGIHGTGAPSLGKAVLDLYAPGYIWQGNTIVKGTNTVQYPIAYPTGTTVI